jgi:hypothetical protein
MQMRSGPHHGRSESSQLGLESSPGRVGEPIRRLHDEIQDQRPPGQVDLRSLTFQLLDRALHLSNGLRTDPRSVVQDAIYGRATEACLDRDVRDPVLPTTRLHTRVLRAERRPVPGDTTCRR